MAAEAANDELSANSSKKAERTGQDDRVCLRDSKHVGGLGVVAEMECAVRAWSPPEALLSDGDVEVAKLRAEVHFEGIEAVCASLRDGRL